MSWSISAVARMSGVTPRTLRHYDAIGLLPPAYTAANGYRYYGEAELVRLHRILLLRELGFGLDRIAAVLADGSDELAALREHRAALVRERDRLSALVRTVDRTIADRETRETRKEEDVMDPTAWFDGFDPARYETEARERWGDAPVDEGNRRVAALSPAERQRVQDDFTDVTARMAALLDEGVPADDPRCLDTVADHYRWVCTFWTPDPEAYEGLGRLYTDDPRFAANYDGVRDGLARYLADAMSAYAVLRLA